MQTVLLCTVVRVHSLHKLLFLSRYTQLLTPRTHTPVPPFSTSHSATLPYPLTQKVRVRHAPPPSSLLALTSSHRRLYGPQPRAGKPHSVLVRRRGLLDSTLLYPRPNSIHPYSIASVVMLHSPSLPTQNAGWAINIPHRRITAASSVVLPLPWSSIYLAWNRLERREERRERTR